MKNILVFLLFFLLSIASVYAISPAHGIWMRNEAVIRWKNSGEPVVERGMGMREWTINGIIYLGFVHAIRITNTNLFAVDSGMWEILYYEENNDRVIYHLTSLLAENAHGTITIVVERVRHERWREGPFGQNPMLTDEEITRSTKGLMTRIVNAEIHNRYRRRMGRRDNLIFIVYYNRTPRRRNGFALRLLLDDYGNVQLVDHTS